jgi:SAM-dependent methyltransferase
MKALLKRLPGVPALARTVRAAKRRLELRTQSPDGIFTDIYHHNRWGGGHSSSGPGSEGNQVLRLQSELPSVLRVLGVTSILDIPCGDFHWMKDVDLKEIDYLGADIVDAVVHRNERAFGGKSTRFRRIDLLKDSLPKVDLVFCRDCLVHFSNADVRTALRNIRASGATYLLTTSFVSRLQNEDILTGEWRPLCLQAAPFSFPPPIRTIVEGCTEGDGRYSDKSMLLWRIAGLPID